VVVKLFTLIPNANRVKFFCLITVIVPQAKTILVFLLALTNNMQQNYLQPSMQAGREFIMQKISGSVVMLNLLRFKPIANYAQTPHLAPPQPISGEEAYQRYIQHTLPHLQKSGGEIIFMGSGKNFLIGPVDEHWHAVLLVRQQSVQSFMAFEQNIEYMKGIGHRTAALEDSRLLPLTENKI
jgi:hypothetical protein